MTNRRNMVDTGWLDSAISSVSKATDGLAGLWIGPSKPAPVTNKQPQSKLEQEAEQLRRFAARQMAYYDQLDAPVSAFTAPVNAEPKLVAVQPKATPKPVPSLVKGLTQAQLDRLVEVESGNKDYTAYNEGSGAYGRYQFIPNTAKAYAKKLGIKGDKWKTPANQDKMFAAFTADNIRGLERKGLPTDLFHIYGAHQQGLSGFSDIMKNNLNPQLEQKMRNNLPGDTSKLAGTDLRNAWINHWQERLKL